MRPALRPGSIVHWDGVDSLQISCGLRLVVLHGLPLGTATLFRHLDGSLTLAELCREVARANPRCDTEGIVADLVSSGVVYDAGAIPALSGHLPDIRERLLREALAWTTTADPAALFAVRQASTLRLLSTDPLTVAIAMQLACAGVGGFVIDASPDSDEVVAPNDVLPGAFTTAEIGKPRVAAVTGLLTQLGASARKRHAARKVDVALVRSRDTARVQHTLTTPYLATAASGTTAMVGPLVLPGRTACVRCIELTRRDVGLAVGFAGDDSEPAPPAIALTLPLAAAHAACAVLELIDAPTPNPLPHLHPVLPALAGHVLSLEVPGPSISLSAVPPHPKCGCCWDVA